LIDVDEVDADGGLPDRHLARARCVRRDVDHLKAFHDGRPPEAAALDFLGECLGQLD